MRLKYFREAKSANKCFHICNIVAKNPALQDPHRTLLSHGLYAHAG
jgi:hypothetical protein